MSEKSSFKDYFSKQATEYALYRPTYPSSIFNYLNFIVSGHSTVWDCGTGSGQVALALTPYFDQVYASDASENQLNNATANPKIRYFISVAESTQLNSNSIDLVTVAQAAHWFRLNEFYAEVKRVLKPEGVIAMWCYGLFQIPEEETTLSFALKQLYDTIESYWPPERQFISDRYQTIDFPFAEIKPPQILMQKQWTIEQILKYISTWSAIQQYFNDQSQKRIIELFEVIKNSVSSPNKKIRIDWPLHWRIGRLTSDS